MSTRLVEWDLRTMMGRDGLENAVFAGALAYLTQTCQMKPHLLSRRHDTLISCSQPFLTSSDVWTPGRMTLMLSNPGEWRGKQLIGQASSSRSRQYSRRSGRVGAPTRTPFLNYSRRTRP